MSVITEYKNSLAKSTAMLFLLIALVFTMAFAFAKVSASTQVAPHAQSSHAYQLACGGNNAPACG